MRLCASLFRGAAAPLGCVICLQLGDVAVFSLCAQYFLNVRGGGGITTLGAFHTVRKPCVARCQNGKLCRFCALIRCAPKERREPSGQRCAYARRCSEASRPRWAALPAASMHSACFSGMERLDQAFRQSYYHTQQPNGQPFGACMGAALGGKMRAITLDFKESHHGRTLPYKRTDPRVFHGAFPGRAVSGNDRKVPEECTSVLAVFGWSARHEGYRYGLEEAPSERRKLFALHC